MDRAGKNISEAERMLLLTRPCLEMSTTDGVAQNDGEARVGQAERRHRHRKSMEVKIEQTGKDVTY